MALTTILKWVLIASLSLLSASAFMSIIDYQMFTKEFTYYYYYTQSTQMSDIVLFGKIFKYLFPIFAPIHFFLVKRKYNSTVIFFAVVLAAGCVGRWLSKTHYQSALVSQTIVSFCVIPILIAPFCLIPLLKPAQRAYAFSIPILFPLLGMKYVKNFNYLYTREQVAPQEQILLIYKYTEELNKIIAIVAIIGATLTVILMRILKQQMTQLNERKTLYGPEQAKLQHLPFSPKNNITYCLFCIVGWGSLLGITWAHQQRYQNYLQNAITRFQVILVEFHLSYISLIVSLVTYTVSKYLKISKFKTIYILNIIGLIGTLFVEITSQKYLYEQLHRGIYIIGGLAVMKIGFLGSVLLVLEYLYKLGHPIFVSGIFIYSVYGVFIACYFITEYIRDQVLCLGIMFLLSLLFVHLPYIIQPQYHKEMKIKLQPQITPFKSKNQNKSSAL